MKTGLLRNRFNYQEFENISEEFNINFGDTSKIFEAELQLAEKVVMNYTCRKYDSPENTINFEDISQVASLSSVPNMLKILGPYEEIDAEVIECRLVASISTSDVVRPILWFSQILQTAKVARSQVKKK
jgi:hypothetical protein